MSMRGYGMPVGIPCDKHLLGWGLRTRHAHGMCAVTGMSPAHLASYPNIIVMIMMIAVMSVMIVMMAVVTVMIVMMAVLIVMMAVVTVMI